MANVKFSAKGRADYIGFRNFLLQRTNPEFTRKTMNQIAAELQRLAATEMLDREDSQLRNPSMRWYWLLDSRFQVFYERRPSGIKVVKLWPAQREPFDPSTI